MTEILEVVGPKGVGKTTICHLILQEFLESRALGEPPDKLSSWNLLLIDASPDTQLTQDLTMDKPRWTLGQLAQRYLEKPYQQDEMLDWACQELLIPIAPDVDLIAIGALPDESSPMSNKLLTYGFQRLIRSYAFVLIDGSAPFFESQMSCDPLKKLLILTPDCYEVAAFTGSETDKSPFVILNQCQGSALSSRLLGPLGYWLDKALEERKIHLIGKLPQYHQSEQRHELLPALFRNCLLRLDLPLELFGMRS